MKKTYKYKFDDINTLPVVAPSPASTIQSFWLWGSSTSNNLTPSTPIKSFSSSSPSVTNVLKSPMDVDTSIPPDHITILDPEQPTHCLIDYSIAPNSQLFDDLVNCLLQVHISNKK